jgi:phosphate uptake regulator
MLARFYEHIGDHALTVSERVTYLVTGTLHNHRG